MSVQQRAVCRRCDRFIHAEFARVRPDKLQDDLKTLDGERILVVVADE